MTNRGTTTHGTKVYEYVNRPTQTNSAEQALNILVRFAVRTGVNWRHSDNSNYADYAEYGALRHAVEIATQGAITREDLDHEVDLEYNREVEEDVEAFSRGLRT